MGKYTDKQIVERLKERLKFHADGEEGFTPEEFWKRFPVTTLQYAAKDIYECIYDRVFED